MGVSAINTSGDFSDFNNFRFESQSYTLSTGTTYHVKIVFDSSAKTLTLTMKANGAPFGTFNVVDMSNFPFTMDKFSITNWFDGFTSFIIRGTVDNIVLSDITQVEDWMKY